jgi:hypothetical protein
MDVMPQFFHLAILTLDGHLGNYPDYLEVVHCSCTVANSMLETATFFAAKEGHERIKKDFDNMVNYGYEKIFKI